VKPLISVIMSVYNDSKNLRPSIMSILNQDLNNFEFLIMDDGSDDDSYDVLKSFSNEKRIKIFQNNNNLGLTRSLNILLNESKGQYIARQDSDDISLSSRLSRQLNYIQYKNLDVCGSRAIIKGSSKITPKKSYYLPIGITLKIKNPFIHGSLILKKSVLDKVNLYDERFTYSQDYKLIKDIKNAGFSMGILKEPLYVLNVKNNISTNHKVSQKYYADCVRKNLVPNE
jgi:glycosyltransferase involved in cell wall biosynthesis